MTDSRDVWDRLAAAEADNARLRRLLDEAGMTSSPRHTLRDSVVLLRTIMRKTAETAPDIESYVGHLEGRLDALMRMRARTDAFGEADLHLLVLEELMVHLVREGERTTIEGPTVRLRPKAAQAMALAVHELASDAVEHGALGRPEGTVDVRWSIEEGGAEPLLVLHWTERGGASASRRSIRKGFGHEMLGTMMAYELRTDTVVRCEPDGLCCTIRFPCPPPIGRFAAEAPIGTT